MLSLPPPILLNIPNDSPIMENINMKETGELAHIFQIIRLLLNNSVTCYLEMRVIVLGQK